MIPSGDGSGDRAGGACAGDARACRLRRRSRCDIGAADQRARDADRSAPTDEPTPVATPTEAPNTVCTADDDEIAKLIRAGTDEAIPQLELLADMGVEELTDLFLPLKVWISGQKAGVEAFTASSCTEAAVVLFIKGMDKYDDIREKFLAWREWGAVGHAFPIGAPGQAVATLEEALGELEATCPA